MEKAMEGGRERGSEGGHDVPARGVFLRRWCRTSREGGRKGAREGGRAQRTWTRRVPRYLREGGREGGA